MKKLHLMLHDSVYGALRLEAERTGIPVVQIAQQAIAERLRSLKREEIHRQLAEYARACAGTDQDLDPYFESAAIDELRKLSESDERAAQTQPPRVRNARGGSASTRHA